MSVLLLYALVPADRTPPSAEATGGLSVLAHGSVAALYDERDERPSTSREDLLAFGRSITEISASGPALPVRYGTVLESLSDLEALLDEREQEWRERLGAVAGHSEVVVHVRDENTPPLARPARGVPGAGREYLMSRAAARRHTETTLEELEAQVAPHCTEVRRLRETDEIRIACLVPRDDVDELRSAVGSWAEAQDGRRVTTTGPWPPFSFTERDPE